MKDHQEFLFLSRIGADTILPSRYVHVREGCANAPLNELKGLVTLVDK